MANIIKPTDEEVLEFLDHSNRIEREYGIEAFQDAQQAWRYAVINGKEFSRDYILGIHHRLLKRLNKKIAGKIRRCAVVIGGEVKNQDREDIRDSLLDLCLSIPETETQIKNWHIAFEKVHPFEDGNGRTGRILMNIQRLKVGLPLLIIHEGKEQQEYYGWFE